MISLGQVTYRFSDEYSGRVLRFISRNRIQAENITAKGGYTCLTIPMALKRELENELKAIGAEYETVSRSGLMYRLMILLRKKGLVIGSLVSLVVLFVISDLIFSFEILCDDKVIKKDVMNVLYQNGIRAGSSISGINMTIAERDLKEKVSGISWAGISIRGCKVIIDVIENNPQPERRERRLPTNLVAKEDAVIESVEVMDGQLMKPVGSAVCKGEIIVSGNEFFDRKYYHGTVEKHTFFQRYTRSIAKVYGSFEKTETFFQPYFTTEKMTCGEPETKSFLYFFDTEIPLFFEADSECLISPEVYEPMTFFGFELPVGRKSVELTRYSYTQRPISETEAADRAASLAETYEHNFLSEYEIRDRSESIKTTEEGVYLTVKYSLYGEISEEVEFFIKK